ncbi:MAG: homoserine dehydrogenase [Phycisphaeraceae bacterium]|nr:homoserine dehydrogenase [Phycisphaeraceae bacterium]
MTREPIGIGLIGCGTVGRGVVELLASKSELLAARLGRSLEIRSILVRDASNRDRGSSVPGNLLTSDPDAFFATPDMGIVAEVAGGCGEVSDHVRRALSMGKHVVTANKALLAAEGPELFSLAHQHGASIGFEASVGGGIPLITAVNFGLMANRTLALYGILNGTCNYVLSRMGDQGQGYDQAIVEAQRAGYAEADPTLDVSGVDTAHKLALLASLAFGLRITDKQIACTGIQQIALEDIRLAAEMGYRIKLLGIAEWSNGRTDQQPGKLHLSVEPCLVHREDQLAQVDGSFNAASIFGDAVGHTLYYGRGAGGVPTASAVVSDLINVAAGWYPLAFERLRLWPDLQSPVQTADPAEVRARYYLRFHAMDRPGVLAAITSALGKADISVSGVIQHERMADRFVPLVLTTHEARRGDLDQSLAQLSRTELIDGDPVVIRIIEMPEG